MQASAPRVSVEAPDASPAPVEGGWRFTWRITNDGDGDVTLESAWFPHGKFRGVEQPISPSQTLPPGSEATLERDVACVGEPGSEVENAFLIMHATWGGQPWRIFVRLRIIFDGDAVPRSGTELVTTQPVGFTQ
jgi:hypothetical protein